MQFLNNFPISSRNEDLWPLRGLGPLYFHLARVHYRSSTTLHTQYRPLTSEYNIFKHIRFIVHNFMI